MLFFISIWVEFNELPKRPRIKVVTMPSCLIMGDIILMKWDASLSIVKHYWIFLTLLLTACLPQTKPVVPDAKITTQQKIQHEVKMLLKQSYIDPITRFVFVHEQDKAYQAVLKTLKAAQAKRCDQVAKRYEKLPKKQIQLDKLSQGYQFSCPDVVFNFAQAVAKKQALAQQFSLKKRDHHGQQAKTLQACDRSYEKMDYANALHHCQLLASQGHAEAQLKLGMMYADGRGVRKDYQAAYIWLTLAVQSGIQQAQVLRDSIAGLFTQKELIDAHDKAAKIANAY